jgi:hypothetical protein
MDSECSRQITFSNALGMYGNEKFVGTGRFLSCASGLKCMKYQTKTIGVMKIAMTMMAQITFARFTKRFYDSLKTSKHCPGENRV